MLSSRTELDAVNTCLEAIGETPVDTLTENTIVDAAIAQKILTDISRAVQMRGWSWNTDKQYKLQPDINNNILVPETALRIDTDGADKGTDIVIRQGRVYNRNDNTFIFKKPLSCEIIWGYTFNDLPELAKEYITIRAARRLHDRMLGSGTLHEFTKEDELEAWQEINKREIEQLDANFIYGSADTFRVVRRRYPGWHV